MSKLIIILSFLLTSPSFSWDGEYENRHDIRMFNKDKQYLVENATDGLSFNKSTKDDTWHFSLFTLTNSANMCDFEGLAVREKENILVYREANCLIHFYKQNNTILVSDVGGHCEKLCGHNAYIDNILFSPTNKLRKAYTKKPSVLQELSLVDSKLINLEWVKLFSDLGNDDDLRLKNKRYIASKEMKFYTNKKISDKIYLISTDNHAIAIIKKSKKGAWQLVNYWKIEFNTPHTYKILPAIYPISDDMDAVSLTFVKKGKDSSNYLNLLSLESDSFILNEAQFMIKGDIKVNIPK